MTSRESRNETAPVRRATPAENMQILLARHWEALSPAERRELDEAISILKCAGSETRDMLTREDLANIVERKAKALTEEYCHGDTGPGGYVWSNKEAEWQVILLEELAEEIRNAKGI